MSVRLSVPQISLNAFLVPVSNSPIQTRPELSTIPTNPPPQHLQIPSISPIPPLLTFPHQHPNSPPYPVPRASLLPHADLSITAFPPTMLGVYIVYVLCHACLSFLFSRHMQAICLTQLVCRVVHDALQAYRIACSLSTWFVVVRLTEMSP